MTVPSRPDQVAVVRREVERIGMRAGLDRAMIDDLDLAVTEACANAIRHGSPRRERNRVHVSFFLSPECITVEVRDEGRGFDPGSKPYPAPQEMRDGGYGLHIMRQLVDALQITWHRGTVVRLTKCRETVTQKGIAKAVPGLCDPTALVASA